MSGRTRHPPQTPFPNPAVIRYDDSIATNDDAPDHATRRRYRAERGVVFEICCLILCHRPVFHFAGGGVADAGGLKLV